MLTGSAVLTLTDSDSGVVVRSLEEFSEIFVFVDGEGNVVRTYPAKLYVSLSRQPVEPILVRVTAGENAPILVGHEGDLFGEASLYLRFEPDTWDVPQIVYATSHTAGQVPYDVWEVRFDPYVENQYVYEPGYRGYRAGAAMLGRRTSDDIVEDFRRRQREEAWRQRVQRAKDVMNEEGTWRADIFWNEYYGLRIPQEWQPKRVESHPR